MDRLSRLTPKNTPSLGFQVEETPFEYEELSINTQWSFFDIVIIILIIFTCVILFERYQKIKHRKRNVYYRGILDFLFDTIFDQRKNYPTNLEGVEDDFNF